MLCFYSYINIKNLIDQPIHLKLDCPSLMSYFIDVIDCN